MGKADGSVELQNRILNEKLQIREEQRIKNKIEKKEEKERKERKKREKERKKKEKKQKDKEARELTEKRYNGIMEYYQDKEKKEEKYARNEANNKEKTDIKNKFDEIMTSINLGDDILDDNNFPFGKISYAYCYIHPINVILYDKTIEYGLIWRKNNNLSSLSSSTSIRIFFNKKNDNASLNTFIKSFNDEYYASKNKDVIDLSRNKEIVELTKKYNFSEKNLYCKYNDSTYYVCEPTKFDYKYKMGSFKKEEYFKTHQISDDLKRDKNKIEALQKKLDDNIHELLEKAEENIKYNKEKTYDRQIESDNLTEEYKNKTIYWLSYVFIGYSKYVLDTIFAGIKTSFGSRWNNVITGFLILIFIIVLIFYGISSGEEKKNEGPNKKPKEENKDFFAVIKSIPADINNIYNSAMKLSSDVGNMMSNSRRTVNDIADAITGDDNSEDIDRPPLEDGRGGDNFLHFDDGNKVISKYTMKSKQIIPIINNINYNDSSTQLQYIDATITLGTKAVNVGEAGEAGEAGKAEVFVPDCTLNSGHYFDDECKLIEHDPYDKVKKYEDSDYEQIKIND